MGGGIQNDVGLPAGTIKWGKSKFCEAFLDVRAF